MSKHDNEKKKCSFDFSKCKKRLVCLRIAYHGQFHEGLAKQEHTSNTIETIIVEALRVVRLIDPGAADFSKRSRIESPVSPSSVVSTSSSSSLPQPERFSRCGRTDKGVSALGNAICCVMRCTDEVAGESPLDYCRLLNGVLPNTVRVVGWAYVPDDFDARFSCTYRVYRYYLSLSGLEVEKMRNACALLEGTHDFRNFCKMDVVNVGSFVRTIDYVKLITSTSEGVPSSSFEAFNGLSYLEVRGRSFLYHQIRCIVTVLVLIGKGLENPQVVSQLLDVRNDSGAGFTAKPCYPLADASPLVLWDCGFTGVESWNMSREAVGAFVREGHEIATALAIRAQISQSMADQVSSWYVCEGASEDPQRFGVTGCDWTAAGMPFGNRKRALMTRCWERGDVSGVKPCATNTAEVKVQYMPLAKRQRENSYEQRVAALHGSRKQRRETNIQKGMKTQEQKDDKIDENDE